MNILFTTNHPAQIHNFRLLKSELEKKGHKIFWLATEKDISKYLLNHYGINYHIIQKPQNDLFSRIKILINNTIQSILFIRRNKIDFIVSRVSPYLALAGFFLRKPHIAMADTESSGIYNKIFVKFISVLLTANSFGLTLKKDQIRFAGNIELCYLHPNRFTPIPREDVERILGINWDDKYVIMRFVSWDAYHDKGLSGFSDEKKIKAVQAFSKYAKIFISTESALPTELEPFCIKIPPEKIHDVLAHAELFFGESATMASENAVLGTPAIFLDKLGRGYTDEEGEYGLVYNFTNSISAQESAIQKGIELLQKPNLKEETLKKKNLFLQDKIDVTAILVWFIENYPESFRIMKSNLEYQYKFK